MDAVLIQEIDRTSPFLENVWQLADKNASTLGFLPHEAFEDYAAHKGIIGAIIENHLAGYLLYRVVKRKNQASITHLCVDSPYRGTGVALRLFEELLVRTQMLYGIGLLCRRDYEEANKLWTRLNFTPVSEKRGRRQKTPSELTFWWYDHGHKTLFDTSHKDKIKVAIDANIFIDFQNFKNPERETSSLKSDWLQEFIELVRTPELLHEINRQSNSKLREKQRKIAQEFSETRKDIQRFNKVCDRLQNIFHINTPTSDLKQVAWAIVDTEVKFFVTRDDGLLKLSEGIFDEFGLSVIRPVYLILRLDELFRIEEYRHMRLAGTNIIRHRIDAEGFDNLAQHFQNESDENKVEFSNYLRQHLINRDIDECLIVEDDRQTPLALFIHERNGKDELTIPLLRIHKRNPDKRLLRYLLLQFLALSAKEKRVFTRITDQNLQETVKEALREDAFMSIGGEWLKSNLNLAMPSQNIANYLDHILASRPEIKPYYQVHLKILKDATSTANAEVMSELERTFWPVKITNADIPTITIPINAHWAALWFDEKLAAQTLFGAEQERAFNREGVYYSAAYAPNISLPGRILWYITKESQNRVAGTQNIRACSRLDDIVRGKPKELFQRFRHLGIYEWENIKSLVRGDLERDIVAYRFSDTQLFTTPVSFAKWQEFTQEEKGKAPPIQSPALTSPYIFRNVYKMGMELE